MTGPILIPAKHDADTLECDCGHTFTRDRLDIRKRVRIYDLECDLDDFDVENYTEVIHECPSCSCCSVENDEISEKESDDQWMCDTCLTVYDDEDEALDCCEDDE